MKLFEFFHKQQQRRRRGRLNNKDNSREIADFSTDLLDNAAADSSDEYNNTTGLIVSLTERFHDEFDDVVEEEDCEDFAWFTDDYDEDNSQQGVIQFDFESVLTDRHRITKKSPTLLFGLQTILESPSSFDDKLRQEIDLDLEASFTSKNKVLKFDASHKQSTAESNVHGQKQSSIAEKRSVLMDIINRQTDLLKQ